MPSVIIEVRKEYNKEDGIKIMDAVHSALQTAFKILPTDKVVRLVINSPERFACPTNLNKPECYTYINIDAYTGRSVEAKRKLYKSIVENLEPLGIPKDHVLILLRETSPENWGVEGGQVASEVNLGYRLDV
ncbi:tautomerase family protein [Gelidibacter sp. F63206]|uniref:tautomerase family protein n=1 Tax=Gelidibacter sp. F63206 TaxID=2926425 RepID=UPI001FF1EA1D|nr:tautomerase family protein [Gelidibacter sp. F63206]MCK0114960.1 tautomerase family protein [Gelidibacter sp. F63206]